MTLYSKWNPNRVHMVRGHPVIYNKADKPITAWDAEQGFKAAISTMHTWASRAFKLAAASPTVDDIDFAEYYLEHFEWQLDNIGTWLGSMREALEEARGTAREQDKIDKLLALAESTTFPEEADTARRMAEARQQKQEAP